MQGAQIALLQHAARCEGRIANTGGAAGILGEDVAADQLESWRIATSATVPGVAYQSNPDLTVLPVTWCECSCRARVANSRHSVLPFAKRFVSIFFLVFL